MAAELGQKTVEFSALVSRTAEESFVSLKELVEKSKSADVSDTEKKVSLLKYLLKTQQRMLRLNVLAKWCKQVPLIQYCQQLGSTLSSHDTCFTQAADSLFFMHEVLQQARAPVYDVPSAIEVLHTGSYQRLPKCIEDVGVQGILTEDEQKHALKKLGSLVRSKLLEVTLPQEISEVKVVDGKAVLRVDGEFKVEVTLGYREHLSLWRILNIELLVGEKKGLVKLEELRRHVLGDDLERRMAASENPFSTLYSVLHEFCVALVMDTVLRQVNSLRQDRWKDAIRFELISDGASGSGQLNQDAEADSSTLRTPGLKVMYWLDMEKNSGTPDPGLSCPFMKIEPGSDLQIKCIHSSFVIDPLTGKEAEFSIDQSCIDVEKLLLRAIYCKRYTRLLEIQNELRKNIQIYRTASDVFLRHTGYEPDIDHKKKYKKSDSKDYEGQEMLYVRAYGSSFFTLGINIRNGRFLLQSFQNILAPTALIEYEEALNQGTMTASDVFISLRSRSILHLFASISWFLGLEVYEHSFNAGKFPKNIFNGSPMLLVVFPDCGNSFILSMQLDKDFKPQFKLLETHLDASGKAHSLKDLGNVKRLKIIDISEIQMHQNEVNLNLLDWRKVLHLPNSVGNQPSEPSLLSSISFDSTFEIAGSSLSTFSSIVDEVFGLEKGPASLPPLPTQNLSSLSNISASQFGPISMNLHNIKAGTSSPMQPSQSNNIAKVSTVSPHYNSSLYSSVSLKGPVQSTSLGSLSSSPVKSTAVKRISTSKSEQDLPSLRSPNFGEISSHPVMDEDHMRILSSTSKDALYGSKPSRLLSPPRYTGARLTVSSKYNGTRTSLAEPLTGSIRLTDPSSSAATPESHTQDITACFSSGYDTASKKEKVTRKRTISDMLSIIPSLHCVEASKGVSKRRKVSESTCYNQPPSQGLMSTEMVSNTEGYSYGDLIAEANKGTAPSSVYVSALLHVVRHCALCIKHARLLSQLEAQGIPYVEEVGLKSASSNIWFRLPFVRGDCWQNICLRLGRPGMMYWDVKINDQHFRDLWELQKGSCDTPWGSGVRMANTSDTDSYIRYDPEGVVLSYQSVEEDSIKKLVSDLLRLSNARMFATGMRKLLGIHADEKLEENAGNSDIRAPLAKGAFETVEKLSEETRRAFRIEAVGLMSLWFSFGSGVLARFVVEWESGKEGCTMHVSPDQLWPHTKFLEDFINGGEVASLLGCIRLTAGPLHALGTATRPARAGPVSILPGVSSTLPSIPKPGGYTPTQNPLPSSSISNAGQVSTVPVGSLAAPAAATNSSFPNNGLHGATMLTAPGRGGPGIVPSSLLPIDVSVVLRGPYWIRIIYRKQFAVDMRCFAGDQVWLQPATPAKANPSIGGSLPCPQFRPFIMEHVAQELNVLEPNFSGGNPAVGLSASNNQNLSSSSQLSAANASRANLLGSSAISRTGNQMTSLNRVGNVLSGSSNLAATSGLSLRRTPGGVPAHVKGELNTAIIGLGDDGGYGGGWVPVVALKKVLRGILKYLGVLWLFAQLPDLLKEILGSILKDNEGSLLNLDPEQPALRFFVGGYVFAVSVHRVQLLLQVLSVKRFHHQQQPQNSTNAPEELTPSEISEICEYFSRRVASEPYDASRVASFITLLTLPISVLREFLKLIAWKKGLIQAQGGDIAPVQKPRIELCLENHSGLGVGKSSRKPSASKSNIHYDRPHNSVDFALTVVLDPAHIPHINAAGGAAWLPYCTSVRLRYSFGDSPLVSFLGMEGSHGGQACWSHVDEWEKCKQRVARTVEVSGNSTDISQGRLRVVADSVQRTLHLSLQGLRDGTEITASSAGT